MKNNSSILVFLQLKQIPNLIAGFFNSKSDGNRQLLAAMQSMKLCRIDT